MNVCACGAKIRHSNVKLCVRCRRSHYRRREFCPTESYRHLLTPEAKASLEAFVARKSKEVAKDGNKTSGT